MFFFKGKININIILATVCNELVHVAEVHLDNFYFTAIKLCKTLDENNIGLDVFLIKIFVIFFATVCHPKLKLSNDHHRSLV